MNEYRSLLEKAGDRVKPSPDAFGKLERRRARKQRSKRIATAAFAFVIAIGGSVGAFAAFRGSNGNGTSLGGGTTNHFYALWPEQTLADAQETQDLVDGGDASVQWREIASETAVRFAEQALGWHDVTASPAVDPTDITVQVDPNDPAAGPVEVTVTQPPAPCPSPAAGKVPACGLELASVTLERLVREGSTGIWSVSAVRGGYPSSDNVLALPLAPGETVVSGQEISIPFTVPEGLSVEAGYEYFGKCGSFGTFSNVKAVAGGISFRVGGANFEESLNTPTCTGKAGRISGGQAALTRPIDGFVFVYMVGGGDPANPWFPFDLPLPEGAAFPAVAAVPVHFVPVSGTSTSPTPNGTAAPDVAQVACDGTSTQVLTPEVAARSDGVHVRVTDTSSSDLSLQFKDIGGDDAPVGTSEVVRPLAPGPVELRCMDPNADAGAPGGFVTLAVVDPHGYFVPTDLQCAGGSAVGGAPAYPPGAKGEQGDPVDITKRNASGLLPTDTVESASYPNAATRIVRVVRDGSVVATFSYFDDGNGGWLMQSYQACTDAGIGAGTSSVGQNPYPRGWFTSCPAIDGTLPPGPTADEEASRVALDFARAFLAGDGATVTALQDPSVPPEASWTIAGTPGGISLLGTTTDQGHLVGYGCGPDVAARTVAVVIDDGTSSASADFTLYLVRRADGWKVWGSY